MLNGMHGDMLSFKLAAILVTLSLIPAFILKDPSPLASSSRKWSSARPVNLEDSREQFNWLGRIRYTRSASGVWPFLLRSGRNQTLCLQLYGWKQNTRRHSHFQSPRVSFRLTMLPSLNWTPNWDPVCLYRRIQIPMTRSPGYLIWSVYLWISIRKAFIPWPESRVTSTVSENMNILYLVTMRYIHMCVRTPG